MRLEVFICNKLNQWATSLSFPLVGTPTPTPSMHTRLGQRYFCGWAFEPTATMTYHKERTLALLFVMDGYKVSHHLRKPSFHSKVDILADTDAV